MANTFKFGNGEWAVGKETALAYNDENSNFKPLPFTFDRASTATVINKDGLIETVGTDEPRIDFLNNTKGHLLLEPSRTNKMPSSEDFNGADWNRASLTINSDDAISPYGTSTADKITFTGNGSLRTWNTFTFTDAYTYSIFVKKGNSRYVTLRSFAFTTSAVIGFDLDTVTSETGGVIEQYPNDWFRLSISKDISSDADKNGYFYFYLPNNLGSTTSVSGNYAYIFGNQIEEGSYATSYIPTSGSTATRSAETIEQQTFLMEGLTDMAMFIDYELPNDKNPSDFRNQIGFRDNANANFYFIQFSNSEQMEFRYRGTAGVNVDMTPTISEATYGLRRKILYTKTGTTLKVFCNGVEVSSVTNSNATTFSSTTENLNISNNYPKELNVRDWRLYNNGLTDQEAIALTTI